MDKSEARDSASLANQISYCSKNISPMPEINKQDWRNFDMIILVMQDTKV